MTTTITLPLIAIPTVYHVGTLNPDDRGKVFASSLEGSWLSASLCPRAWTRIAKLGGQPTWELSNANALYLDANALNTGQHACMMNWAIAKGLVAPQKAWAVHYKDTETKSMRFFYAENESNAQAEVQGLIEEQGASAWCEPEAILTLTALGRERANQPESTQPGDDFVVQFWVEDVLSFDFPHVVGVAWNEEYAPSDYSAPRLAILPTRLPEFTRQEVELATLDDDELLAKQAPTRLLSPDLAMSHIDDVNASTTSIALQRPR